MPTLAKAVRLCVESEETIFGRPGTWAGSGRAVDLGCRVRTEGIHQLAPLGESSFNILPWNPTSRDLLLPWETISLEKLKEEKDFNSLEPQGESHEDLL